MPTTFALRSICGDVEREVGRGDAFAQRAGQVHADDVRREEIDRLAEHARFGLDAADAPADDAEAVDHGRVRIGADERVGIINRLAVDRGGEHALGEIFEIDLMDDADARRHDLEGLERLHAPLEKLVALAVALEFQFQIALQRVGRAGEIHLHGVIHDQIHRHERLDDFRDSSPASRRRGAWRRDRRAAARR